MNTATLKHGDTILVRIRRFEFEATVDKVTPGGVTITPPKWCSYRAVTARECVKRVRRYDPRITQARGPE